MKDALQRLEDTEQRFRNLLKEAPVSTALLTGPDLIIEIANDASLNLWGKDESIIGKKLLEAMPEMEGQVVYNELLKVYATGITYEGKESAAYLKINNVMQPVFVNFIYKAIRDPEGNITGVLAMGYDVTEQVLARERIKEAEESARLAIESAGIGTFDFNFNTKYIVTSPRFDRIFGFDAPGKFEDYINVIHPDDQKIRGAAHLHAFESGTLFYEARIIFKDGSIHWVRINGKVFYAEHRPFRMLGTALDITEQKNSHKLLIESEARFRTLITETSMVAMGLYIGPDIRIQYVNDVMIRFWGKDKSVIGKTFEEAIPELKGQHFLGELRKVYQTGEVYEGKEDLAQLRVDGRLQDFYFNYTYKALRNSEDEIYGIHHVAVDVTETVLAKKELMESEQNFRKLVMQAPVGICIVKDDPIVAEVLNDTFLKIVGKTRGEFETKSYWEVLADEREVYEPIITHVFQTGTSFIGKEYEITLQPNGEREKVFIDFVCEPLRESNDSINRVMILAIEVTDKVVARKKIEESRDFLNAILESLPQMAWTTNAVGETTYVNKQWLDYTGLPTGIGYWWSSIIHDKDLDHFLEKWKASVDKGLTFQQEVRYRKHSGEFRWHLAHAMPIMNAASQVTMWVGTCTDIHDRKLSLEGLEKKVNERTRDLQRSNIELQQFAYVASHDLQEPLRKITTFTELLDNSLNEKDDKSRGYLNKIAASARRMLALIQGVLNFSQLSRGGDFFTTVDLNNILSEVKNDFELLISEKGAHIYSEPLPAVQGIPLQLNQLFSNLLSNALKFSEPGRNPEIYITISELPSEEVHEYPALTANQPYIRIEFRDNGIGFSQEYAKQVFVIFQRLNDRQSYAGTGIGLALCKRIVLNHKGEIYAKSAPGEGASFYIILPKNLS